MIIGLGLALPLRRCDRRSAKHLYDNQHLLIGAPADKPLLLLLYFTSRHSPSKETLIYSKTQLLPPDKSRPPERCRDEKSNKSASP
ncbi:hypothetical protein B7R56_20275 [Pseudomonas savastanoi pv. retacarpa]|nr:hypothetical protein B7R56_20275 [Pseudomonas savastanoi pv. retacarpa]